MSTNTKNISPGMRQYLEIKEQYKDYLLFYRMGDFYELFFDDARAVSSALGLTLTKRGTLDGENVPMCGVPFHAYETYMARLIKTGFKVAICEQVEDPAEARKRGYKSVVRREVVRLVTSGTITEDTLLEAKRNNYLTCVYLAGSAFGVAWIDISTGVFYTESIPTSGGNEANALRGFFSRIMPEEILLPDTLLQKSDLFALFNEYRDNLTVFPAARFNYANAEKKMCDFFEVSTTEVFADFTRAEIIAAGQILDYVENTQRQKMPRIMKPVKVSDAEFVEMDAATRYNLNLIDGKFCNSLISVIDCTITGAGGRMLNQWLTMPLVNIEAINQRLDNVEFFIRHREIRDKVRNLLRDMPDIERSLSRLSVGRGGPRELLSILQSLYMLPELRQMIEMYEHADVLDKIPSSCIALTKRFGNYSGIVRMLRDGLIDDKDKLPNTARDGGFIKHGYSPELDSLKEQLADAKAYLQKVQAKYAEQTGIESLKIKYNNLIGYFIEVQNKYTTQLLNNPDFIHRQSILNASRFITKELTELESNIRNAEDRSVAMEINLYEDMLHSLMIIADDLIDTSKAVAEIDVSAALAELAVENNYCRPQLDDSCTLEIIEGRHPIVEAALRRNNENAFVGNDCRLNGENERIWLLTGPNMAGKSTFLRQNAIIIIMAQIGSFVPAKSAHIGLVNKVFSRVGASDDLSRGRSTFMVEMLETASILNRADEHSFVILDEIGRGTATFDGLSIAWAVVEYLHDVNKCRALFATHYHELTVLSERLSALELYCMKVKEFKGQVLFMHEVIKGAADRSYGIHVAKLAGLPKAVIERSQQVLETLETENAERDNLSFEGLPLFSFASAAAEKSAQISPLERELRELDPDNLSAREALDKLYELKQLVKDD